MNFKEKLAWGEQGEEIVCDYLKDKEDRMVMPLYKFPHTTAPMLETNGCNFVCPDIFSIKDGKTIFVESKRKNSWCYGTDTGIDMRLWKHYTNIVRHTELPLEIYFLQERMEPTGLYRIKIDTDFLTNMLTNPDWFNATTLDNGTRMILFPIKILEKLI